VSFSAIRKDLSQAPFAGDHEAHDTGIEITRRSENTIKLAKANNTTNSTLGRLARKIDTEAEFLDPSMKKQRERDGKIHSTARARGTSLNNPVPTYLTLYDIADRFVQRLRSLAVRLSPPADDQKGPGSTYRVSSL